MRFSDTIRVNANPSWWRYYLPYEDLKKTVSHLRYLRHTDFSTPAPTTPAADPLSDDELKPPKRTPTPSPFPPTTPPSPHQQQPPTPSEPSSARATHQAQQQESADARQPHGLSEPVNGTEDGQADGADDESSEDDPDAVAEAADIATGVERPPSTPTSSPVSPNDVLPAHSSMTKKTTPPTPKQEHQQPQPNLLQSHQHHQQQSRPPLARTASARVLQHLDSMRNRRNDEARRRKQTSSTSFPHHDKNALDDENFPDTDPYDVEDDELFPVWPPVASPEDAQRQFAAVQSRFFRRLRLRARLADAFYTRLLRELGVAASQQRAKAQWMLAMRQQPHIPSSSSYTLMNGSSLCTAASNTTTTVGESSPLLPVTQSDSMKLPSSLSSPSLVVPPVGAIDDDVFSHGEDANFKSDYLAHYYEINEAINFSTLNLTAFRKILKKHDKWTGLNTKEDFLREIEITTSLSECTKLEELRENAVKVFADVFMQGDREEARHELDHYLRDLILYERSPVWRTAFTHDDKAVSSRTVRGFRNLKEEQEQQAKFIVKGGVLALATAMWTIVRLFPGLLRALVGADGVATFPHATFEAANRCFALVVLAVVLWAGVVIPLHATSFVVMTGCVLGAVFLNEETGEPLSASQTSEVVFQHFGSPTLLLILSVYALAAAFSKFEIDKQVATLVLSKLPRRADVILFTLMMLSVGVSTVVSNVAAPVLLNSVMKPTFELMEARKAHRKYIQCLLLGIMVSCNVGGFASPIASPQSAVAIGLLHGDLAVDFGKWMAVALPLCLAMVGAFFVVLVQKYRMWEYDVPRLAGKKVKYRWWHWGVVITLVVTTFVWVNPNCVAMFGSTGIEAAVPLVVLFGTGILTKGDFNSLPWDVVVLVAGGSVLGAAVKSSRLLDLVSYRLLGLRAVSTWVTFATLCGAIAIVASFVSHTVSALILLPILVRVGVTLGRGQMFLLGGTFAASCAMATNVSSFPNISATEVRDGAKEAYVTSESVLVMGSVMTVVALGVLISVGYGLLWLMVK